MQTRAEKFDNIVFFLLKKWEFSTELTRKGKILLHIER